MDEEELEGRLLALRMAVAAAVVDAGATGKLRGLIDNGALEAGPTAIMTEALDELEAILAAAEYDQGR